MKVSACLLAGKQFNSTMLVTEFANWIELREYNGVFTPIK